jgi:hypothetical protein
VVLQDYLRPSQVHLERRMGIEGATRHWRGTRPRCEAEGAEKVWLKRWGVFVDASGGGQEVISGDEVGPMHHCRRRTSSRMRSVAVLVLTVAVTRVPLPAPDYHNVRHHDGPNEVCEHHDHLLRWHPWAGAEADVSILHWHWLVPLGMDDPVLNPDGPRVHAHRPEPPAFPAASEPGLVEEGVGRRTGGEPRLSEPPGMVAGIGAEGMESVWPVGMRSGARAGIPPGCDAAVRRARLQRWTC